MLYLAGRLEEVGLVPRLVSQEQLCWVGGQARIVSGGSWEPVNLVFRFFPAEWLDRLTTRTRWECFLAGGHTPTCNPAYAVLTQSKRFPLTWDDLSTPLPTWRSLLPETRSPDHVAGRFEDGWVVKPALGHEGYNVGMFGVNDASDWGRIRTAAVRDRSAWVAQRRFELVPVDTPNGPLYPCLGIYVIAGQVAGAYGRVASRPLIDDRSREVAVLVKKTESGKCR
jgi:glutathionylspermidine synthase